MKTRLLSFIFIITANFLYADEPVTEKNKWTGNINYFATGASLAIDANSNGNVDTDAQPVSITISSSDIPTGASVLQAFLYWGGTQEQIDVSCSSILDDEIIFTAPGLASETIVADMAYCSDCGSSTYDMQVFRVDITELINNGDLYGSYSVSGYSGLITDNAYDNASFSVVIVYSESTLSYKSVILYDGLEVLQSSTQTYNLSGFEVDLTPQGNLTWYIIEGDNAGTGTESVIIDGTPGAAGPLTLTDAINPANNPMNQTINTTTPSQLGIIGIDIDSFDITQALSAGDISVDLTYSAGTDSYGIVYNILSINEESPVVPPLPNSISGTISIDEQDFSPGDFGVAAYEAGVIFDDNSALAYGTINADGSYSIDLSAVDESITDFVVLFLGTNHVWEFYNGIPYTQPQNANPVQRGAIGIDAHMVSNTISGLITVQGEFINTNFGVSVFDANAPLDINSPLAFGDVNPDGTYTINLNSVPFEISEFKVLFLSGSHIWEFYDNVLLENPESATIVTRGATNINAHLITNFISGTITIDDEFIANNFGVGVYQAGVPFDESAALAWGNVNEDGSYIVDLSGVDNSITEFIVLFVSAYHIYEFYNDVPIDQPENATIVSGGSTGIDAHLQSNSIRGTITAEEGFNDVYYGVTVFEYGTQFDPVTSTGLAYANVNSDGTYSIDLSGVDRNINEFTVLFLGTHHIWEYYGDFKYWENSSLSPSVTRGATGIDAYLNTNTIKGTITLDEGDIVPEELFVAVVENGTEDPINSISLPYFTEVHPDGSYIMDLTQVDLQITELNVLFIGLKYIVELYNDVPWQTPELSQLVRRGDINIDAHLLYDHIPPVLTVNDLTFNNDYHQAGAEVWLTASATDNSGLQPQITFVPESRSFFPLGVTTVEATATDGAGNQDVKSFTVTILDAEPPEITAPDIVVGNDPGQAGAIVIFNVTATDNSGEEPIITLSHESGDFFPLGVSVINCTATDGTGNIATNTFTVEVLDIEPPVITAPDIIVNNDPGESGAIVTFNISATDNSGEISIISCTHESGIFFPIGVTQVSCTATDTAGNVANKAFSVTVIDAEPPLLTVSNITVNNDPGLAGASVSLSAVATDNSGLEPVIELSPSSGSFFPLGTTTTFATATDEAGNQSVESFTVTVLDVEPPVLIVENVNVDIYPDVTGAYVDLTAIATDNSGLAPTIMFNPASGSFFPIGITTVECSSFDGAGNSTTELFTVTVNVIPPENNLPEILSINTSMDPIPVNTNVNASSTYEDDNLTDAIWDWGDGTVSVGEIYNNTIEGVHQYIAAGVYTLSLTIIDEYGETDSESFQYIVIYDPNGGFVTGGGWILSQAGAYVPDPTLEGKANFGFVAKYKKGTTVPDGNTEFQFKAGDLNFASTDYDWLIVAGDKAKFKGEGTINNSGEYGFMLSAVDGDTKLNPDMFWIKIWEMATESVVYDNQPGDPTDADATDAIEGGSISVHTPKLKAVELTMDSENEQPDMINQIMVYPNPVKEKLNVKLPQEFIEANATYRIHLYNVAGSDLIQANILNNSKDLLEIDMSEMPYGMYTLIITDQNATYRFSVIKE